MTLTIEEFQEVPGKGPSCAVGKLALPPDDMVVFLEAMERPDILSTVISRTLRAHGYDVSASSIQRHRRGGCACKRYA
jgi:hypothetical protein